MSASDTSFRQTDIHIQYVHIHTHPFPRCSIVLYAGAISVALVLPFVTARQELDDFHACLSLPAHTAAAGFHKASLQQWKLTITSCIFYFIFSLAVTDGYDYLSSGMFMLFLFHFRRKLKTEWWIQHSAGLEMYGHVKFSRQYLSCLSYLRETIVH